MMRCSSCKKEIQGQYVRALGKNWHADCFCCAACGQKFADGKFIEQNGQAYHESCYRESFAPRCAGCGGLIDGVYTKHEGRAYHHSCYLERFAPRCAGCGGLIDGPFVRALDQTWHKEHFVCAICGKPFMGKKFYVKDGKAYCKKDYENQFAMRCAFCGKPVSGRYLVDAWGNASCEKHEGEAKCHACGRLICENITKGGVKYEDGRYCCTLCRKTAVDDEAGALRIFKQVKKELKRWGLDGLENVPLQLTGAAALKKLSRKRQAARQVCGLTRTQRMFLNGIEEKHNVEQILVLYGMPEIYLGAVIAHELGHAWLFTQRFPKLSPRVEEGICDMLSARWLSQQCDAEAVVHLKMLEENTDPIYGQGYRAVKRASTNRSLLGLLEYVRQNQRLPRSSGEA